MREIRAEFLIPERRLDELRAGIETINKRAAKLGCEPVRLTIGEHEMVELPRDRADDPPRFYKAFNVVVEGSTPKLAGWEFLATLLHFYGDEAGNIIQAVPGVEVPKEYRDRGPVCDHCKTKRRRNKTYLLLHEDGRRVQVGSTCIGDFLGRSADNPEGLAAFCEALNRFLGKLGALEDGDGEGGCDGPCVYRSYVELPVFLANTASSIREFGWLSRGKAYETGREGCATADEVSHRLFSVRRYDNRDELKRLTPTASDFDEAKAAIEWGKAIGDDCNDYLHNVKTLCEAGFTTHHTFGVAASIVFAYRRHLGKLAERAKAADSEYFGTVGKREVFHGLRVTRISSFDSFYGTKWVVGFEDADGNRAVWFSTKLPRVGFLTGEHEFHDTLVREELAIGETVIVKATVKEHGEYKGARQTVLTRCDINRFDPDTKEAKKILRAIKKTGRVFDNERDWECYLEDKRYEEEARKAAANG